VDGGHDQQHDHDGEDGGQVAHGIQGRERAEREHQQHLRADQPAAVVTEPSRAEPVHHRAHQEPGEVDRAQHVDQAHGLQRHPALQQDRREGGEEERVPDVGDEEQRADDREPPSPRGLPPAADLPEHETSPHFD
jgi:hypothetical protein